MNKAISPNSWASNAWMLTIRPLEPGLMNKIHISYTRTQSSCTLISVVLVMNAKIDRLKIISTALVRIWASQCLALTANMRHLLSRISARATPGSSSRTNMNIRGGNKATNPKWKKCAKPLVGFNLCLIFRLRLITAEYYNKISRAWFNRLVR